MNSKQIFLSTALVLDSQIQPYIPLEVFRFSIALIPGQTVVVDNPCDRTITRQHADGQWTFIIPRPLGGGTIIGGTKEINNFNIEVDIHTRQSILSRAAQLYPPIITNDLPPTQGGFIVKSDIVGRRPSRHGGPRIERECFGDKIVIHAYGMGGRGYEISWGVAAEVLKLVKDTGVE